jgi:hypothetical protein
MITFDPLPKLHNSFLIILLNNLELIPSYLLKLKEAIKEEWMVGAGLSHEEKKSDGGIESCLEELEIIGGKFEDGRKERMKLTVDFLKITVRKLVFEHCF